MATATEALDFYGFTIQQANDFIHANVDQPATIFDAAFQHGITIQMLSEITGYQSNDINGYFATSNLDTKLLDVQILVNSDLGSLAHLVNFNDHSGVLSTASLRDQVKLSLQNSNIYDGFFGPVIEYQDADNVYTPDELGVSHLGNLGNISATNENIESIFYGTLLNIYSALDDEELAQITNFPEDKSFADYQAFLFDALSDIPSSVNTDNELAKTVATEAAFLIESYVNSDVFIVGILDHSLLGIAVAES